MQFRLSESASEPSPMIPVAMLVTWLSCVAVGASGFLLHYPRRQPANAMPPPAPAELVHVELTDDLPAPRDVVSPAPPPLSPLPQPPALDPSPAPAPAPPLAAVATPAPTIEFAVPVDGPAQVVAPGKAVPAPATANNATVQPSVAGPAAPQRLTYGQGEGRQPAPAYPPEAVRSHQQGTVIVRFTVNADGRVTSAQAVSASPYPLLNQAAIHVVRTDWRFRSGPPRSYEVAIEFQLEQR